MVNKVNLNFEELKEKNPTNDSRTNGTSQVSDESEAMRDKKKRKFAEERPELV